MNINHLLLATVMELRRIYHDKRRMFILILGPILICLIFGYVFYYSPQDVDITVFVDRFYNTTRTPYSETTRIINTIDVTDRFAVTQVYSLSDAFTRLSEGKTRAVVVMEEGTANLQTIKVTIDVTDRIMQQIIQMELPQVLDMYTKRSAIEFLSYNGLSLQQAAQIVNPFIIDIKTNEWTGIKYFDLGASGVIVLFIMGICLLMSVTAITSERSTGTIERVLASPYKSSEIILSKLIAHILLAIVVAILIIASLKLCFNIVLGNVFLLFLISILIGTNAVVLGVLVSAITNTELASVMGGTICWFQSMILMGYTWPLETMHPVIAWVSRLTPFAYGLHAIRRVNLNNWGLNQIWFDLVILLAFTLVQALLAIRFLRRDVG